MKVDETNGEFAHFPVPRRFGGTKGAWLLHEDHMSQGLVQADDFGTTTFHHGDTAAWVSSCTDPYLLGLWEKWRLHHNYVMAWLGVGVTNQNRDTYMEERSKGGKTTYERGVGLWGCTPEQKSEWSRKAGRGNKGVKKKPGHKVGQAMNTQVWESLVDGFRSTAAGVVSHHKGRGWDPKLRKKVDK